MAMKTHHPTAPNILGHLQVALAMCIVGSAIPAGKLISAEMPVFVASFLRFSMAALLIVPLNRRLAGALAMPRRSERLLLGLQAFFGVFLFSIFLFLGLKRTSAVNAGVILGMLPAVTALLSVVLLKERLTLRHSVGIAFSVFGAVLLESRNSGLSGVGAGALGVLLIFGAVVCEALFSVIGKLAGVTLPPVTITAWITIIGVALFAPCAVVDASGFNFSAVSTRTWLLLAYYAVVVTVIGFTLFYAGLAKISAVAAGVHMAWAPLSAMMIAVIFLDEPFAISDLISGASVIAAVLVVSAGGKGATPNRQGVIQRFKRQAVGLRKKFFPQQ